MSRIGRLISRNGYPVKDLIKQNIVMSSEFTTPQIAKILKFTTSGQREHGLKYAPTFRAYMEDSVDTTLHVPAIRGYFGGGISLVYVDDTNVYYNGTDVCYVVIEVERLSSTTPPQLSNINNFGSRFTIPGVNIASAKLNERQQDSNLGNYQILRTGTLSISLPSENINNSNTLRTVSYQHNLGYVPLFDPCVGIVSYIDEDNYTTRTLTDADTFIVNDADEGTIPAGAYGPGMAGETARLYATTTAITLEINRYNMLPFDEAFGARTAEVYYTLYKGQMNKEIDFLI